MVEAIGNATVLKVVYKLDYCFLCYFVFRVQ